MTDGKRLMLLATIKCEVFPSTIMNSALAVVYALLRCWKANFTFTTYTTCLQTEHRVHECSLRDPNSQRPKKKNCLWIRFLNRNMLLLRQKSRTSVVDPDPQCTTFLGLSHSFPKNISLDPNVFHIRKSRIFLSYSSLIPYKHSCREVLLKQYFLIYFTWHSFCIWF